MRETDKKKEKKDKTQFQAVISAKTKKKLESPGWRVKAVAAWASTPPGGAWEHIPGGGGPAPSGTGAATATWTPVRTPPLWWLPFSFSLSPASLLFSPRCPSPFSFNSKDRDGFASPAVVRIPSEGPCSKLLQSLIALAVRRHRGRCRQRWEVGPKVLGADDGSSGNGKKEGEELSASL